MKKIWLAMAGLLAAMPAQAQAPAQVIAAPNLHANDTWVYQSTSETKAGWRQAQVETIVLRVGQASVAVGVRPFGSTMPQSELLTGLDWSRTRAVNGIPTAVVPAGRGQDLVRRIH